MRRSIKSLRNASFENEMLKRIKKCGVIMTRTMAGYVSRMAAMARPPEAYWSPHSEFAFAFSENLSAENSKLSAESGLQRLKLLECMAWSGLRLV